MDGVGRSMGIGGVILTRKDACAHQFRQNKPLVLRLLLLEPLCSCVQGVRPHYDGPSEAMREWPRQWVKGRSETAHGSH
jgi:hypothetical protein